MSEMIEATMAVTKLGAPDLMAPEAFGPDIFRGVGPAVLKRRLHLPIRARISRTDHRPGRFCKSPAHEP